MHDNNTWDTNSNHNCIREAWNLLTSRGYTEASPNWMSDICSVIAASLAARDAALRQANAEIARLRSARRVVDVARDYRAERTKLFAGGGSNAAQRQAEAKMYLALAEYDASAPAAACLRSIQEGQE